MADRYTRRDLLALLGRVTVTAGSMTVLAQLIPGCGGDDGPDAARFDDCDFRYGHSVYHGASYGYEDVYSCAAPVDGADCYDNYALHGTYTGDHHQKFLCTTYVPAE